MGYHFDNIRNKTLWDGKDKPIENDFTIGLYLGRTSLEKGRTYIFIKCSSCSIFTLDYL